MYSALTRGWKGESRKPERVGEMIRLWKYVYRRWPACRGEPAGWPIFLPALEANRLTNSPTCFRSQTNHQGEPTNRNYSGGGPTNRNYIWESRLFLHSLIRRTEMGERGVSDRPEHSQADPSKWGGMGQPGGGGAWGVTWRSGGSKVVLQKSPERADGNSC